VVLVDATLNQPLSLDLIYLGLGHLAVHDRSLGGAPLRPVGNPLILPIVALLNGLGLVMIHRLDLGALRQATELGVTVPTAAAPRQLAWTGLAVALLGGTQPPTALRRLEPPAARWLPARRRFG
jgi:hypothetical protein